MSTQIRLPIYFFCAVGTTVTSLISLLSHLASLVAFSATLFLTLRSYQVLVCSCDRMDTRIGANVGPLKEQ
jgi:hypothetical protein